MSCALDISPLAVQSPTVRTPPASRVRSRPATDRDRDRKRQKLQLQEELARLDDEEDIDDDTGREAADDDLELADLPPIHFPDSGEFSWTQDDPTHPVQAPFTHNVIHLRDVVGCCHEYGAAVICSWCTATRPRCRRHAVFAEEQRATVSIMCIATYTYRRPRSMYMCMYICMSM